VKLIAITIILANFVYGAYWYLSPPPAIKKEVRAVSTVMPGRTLVLVDELSERDLIERLERIDNNRSSSGMCWHYGPLTEDESVKLVSRIQTAVATATTVMAEVVIGQDHQLLIGAFDTEDAALVALPQIREFVKDSFVVEIDDSHYISVGIFNVEQNAETKRREVEAKGGMPVIKRELPRNQQQYWVVWDFDAVQAPADFFSDDFNELKLNGKLLKNPCEEVAQN